MNYDSKFDDSEPLIGSHKRSVGDLYLNGGSVGSYQPSVIKQRGAVSQSYQQPLNNSHLNTSHPTGLHRPLSSSQLIYFAHYSGLESIGASGMTILEELVEAALKVCVNSRAVSGVKSRARGAVLLTHSGKTYNGCDVRMSGSDSVLGVGAERAALLSAVADGASRFDVSISNTNYLHAILMFIKILCSVYGDLLGHVLFFPRAGRLVSRVYALIRSVPSHTRQLQSGDEVSWFLLLACYVFSVIITHILSCCQTHVNARVISS
jgi:hypothetical protein